MKDFKKQLATFKENYGISLNDDSPKTQLQKKICSWIQQSYESDLILKTITNNSAEMRSDWLNCAFKPKFDISHQDYNIFAKEMDLDASEFASVAFSFYCDTSPHTEYFLPYIGLWDMMVAACKEWLTESDLNHMDISAYDKGFLLYAFIGSNDLLVKFEKLFTTAQSEVWM